MEILIDEFNYQVCYVIQKIYPFDIESRIDKGNVLTSNVVTEVVFETCTFLNCGDADNQAITKFYDAFASIKYVGCTFNNELQTNSDMSKIFQFTNNFVTSSNQCIINIIKYSI